MVEMGAALLDFDRDHLWHPYSSMTRPGRPYLVESASGTRLRLRVDGEPREVVDAMASWWCAIHGYAVPELDAAARAQLGRMSHVMFGGLTHTPAVELGRRLVNLAPPALAKVFLADSGSVAVEVAMKMAWQAQPGRTQMFTIRGGYHGDTFSCMSVCDPDGGMHQMYGGLVPRHLFAPRPPAGLAGDLTGWRREVTTLFERHAEQIAAVILEPVLQGAGGMYVYPPAAVRFLADLARAHGALVIFDRLRRRSVRLAPGVGDADHPHRARAGAGRVHRLPGRARVLHRLPRQPLRGAGPGRPGHARHFRRAHPRLDDRRRPARAPP